jgi:hypothetical protein
MRTMTDHAEYTGCPKSPDAVLRGYIPGTTEMAKVLADLRKKLFFTDFCAFLFVK